MLPPDTANLNEAELVRLITYHNEKYWKEGQPEISDEDYDLLVRALQAIAPEHPLLQQVEAPSVAGGGKIRHEKPMLSLDKAYSLDEVMTWVKKFARSGEEKLLVQPKYDGISALWENGILSTRGDGFEGEDISDKVALIELEHPAGTMPLSEFHGNARGEIVIREDDFKTLYPSIRNRNGQRYKNSRNAVAGIMGLKDIREMILQKAKLTLADYSLHSRETTVDLLPGEWNEIVEYIETMPYPMDGIVIKLADTEYGDSLGNTAHHPRSQIAFKFSGVRRTSVLRSVEWSFGKNCLTPVAEIDPVEISGTTIRRASLHNLQNILDKDLHIGDTVTIERAGDVIPYIVSAEPGENRKSCLIETCPCCGGVLLRDLPELRCTNPDCFETRLQLLLSAVKNIGIERLGEPVLRKLMKALSVRTIPDLFHLTANDFLRVEGFAALSAENLYREIQSARTVPDWQILASLNIKGIGPNIAKSILTVHPFGELRTKTASELAAIDGIGPERASALEREFRDQAASLDELLSCVTMLETKGETPSKTICFTGKMPQKRSYYEKLAKAAGYAPADSVTSSLTLLVAMDPGEKSSKLTKAGKLNIPVKSLAEWLAEQGVGGEPEAEEEPDLFSGLQ